MLKALLLFIILSSQSSQAFVLLSGPEKAALPATPGDPTVTFYWNGKAPKLRDLKDLEGGVWKDLDDKQVMENIIRLALDKWSQIPGSYLKLDLVVDEDASINPEDKKYSLDVRKDTNKTSAAYAIPQIAGGKITDCDISINDTSTSGVNLAYTIIHELGHCAGLGHNHTNYKSIMGYSRSPDKKLALGADDMAGVIYLYPDHNYDGEGAHPMCGTIAGPRSPTSQALMWLLWLLPLLGAFLVRICSRQSRNQVP